MKCSQVVSNLPLSGAAKRALMSWRHETVDDLLDCVRHYILNHSLRKIRGVGPKVEAELIRWVMHEDGNTR